MESIFFMNLVTQDLLPSSEMSISPSSLAKEEQLYRLTHVSYINISFK